MRSGIAIAGIFVTMIVGIATGIAIQNLTFSTKSEASQLTFFNSPDASIDPPSLPMDDGPTPTLPYRTITITPRSTLAPKPAHTPTAIPTSTPVITPSVTPLPTISLPQRPSFHPYTHDSLLMEREGFGALTTGGNGENYFIVTTTLDDPNNPLEGSLRKGLTLKESATIVFSVDGTIFLDSDIAISSNKTLDGRGRSITITNAGLRVENSENIIITNISIVNGKPANTDGPDVRKCNFPDGISGDALEIRESKNIWIHRNTFSAYCDGLIDLVNGSNNITVSWNILQHHNKTMLIGSGPSREATDTNITATLHHNILRNNTQRQPRVRFARVDMYNNLISNWDRVAVAHSMKSQVISENNIFEAGEMKTANTSKEGDDPLPGSLALRGNNLLLNGALLSEFEAEKVFSRPYTATIEPASLDLKSKLENEAGAKASQETGFQNLADINNDGVINTADLVHCVDEYGTSTSQIALLLCDLDHNNRVDALDYSRVVTELM